MSVLMLDLDLPAGLVAERRERDSYPEVDIEILCDAGNFHKHAIEGYEIIVRDDGEEIGRCEYYHLSDDAIGYLAWTEVDEAYQRRGVGSEIRQAAIDHLWGLLVGEIYTGPLSDAGKGLARSQDFVPVENVETDEDDLLTGTYFVKRRDLPD